MNVSPDVMAVLRGATIQHGPSNRRIYLMKLGDADPARLLPDLAALARERGYTKIFVKAPSAHRAAFVAAGYRVEATVPGLYRGRDDIDFLGLFLDPARAQPDPAEDMDAILAAALARTPAPDAPPPPAGTTMRACGPEDAEAMAALFRSVFPSYPFPIGDPNFLRTSMRAHTRYFGVRRDGAWIAIASAEMDPEGQCAEMTDFATTPACRGRGIAGALLALMEAETPREGVRTAYTIARAVSPGINAVFARRGYRYAGRLVNNTQIAGRIESMNVWHKPLSPADRD